MKIAIVGWGVEGQSAYRYFGPDNEYLIANEEPRVDFPAQSAKVKVQFIDRLRTPGITSNVDDLSYLNGIENCDKIVYTPTSRKTLEKKYPENDPIWAKTTTSLHIFFESAKTENVIGVTGTKGKGTTTTLIAKMLEASGKKVYIGGNIGNSPLDFLSKLQPTDWVVLEISNFQLYKFPYSPHIAVCLMIIPEHLDWHPNIEEYMETKANIFKNQKPNDIAIYFADNEQARHIAGSSPGKKIPYFDLPGAIVRDEGAITIGQPETEIIHTKDVKLIGRHNLQNVCAAITAVWQVSQDIAAITQVLKTFSGLEHRLEFVREFRSAKYYDDSFGTTPDTTIVAIQAIIEPKVLILGGSDKGSDYSSLIDEVIKNRVHTVIAIGQTGPKIAEMLKAKGFTNVISGLDKMTDVVATASKKAKPGDAVLLSTASASFGLFKDYKDRGDQFKQAVLALS